MLFIMGFVGFAFADPPPPAVPGITHIPAFCFRITDIQALDDGGNELGAGGNVLGAGNTTLDDYRLTFEVLNWTNVAAHGLYMAVNEGSGINGQRAALAGSGVKTNGSTRTSAGVDTLAGNVNNFTSEPFQAGDTHVVWTAAAGNEIQNHDLLGDPILLETTLNGVGQGNPQNVPAPIDALNQLTYDDSINVRDGFTVDVTSFNTNSAISMNWWLLDAEGAPIGTTTNGNAMAFGTFNLALIDELNPITPPFSGNTGYTTLDTLFFDGQNVGDNAASRTGINFDATPEERLVNTEILPGIFADVAVEVREKIVGEVGVAVTGSFLTETDAAVPVTTLTPPPPGGGDPTPIVLEPTLTGYTLEESVFENPPPTNEDPIVPEPSTFVFFALAGLCIAGKKRTK